MTKHSGVTNLVEVLESIGLDRPLIEVGYSITATAASSLNGATAASITLRSSHGLRSVGSTDGQTARLDAVQHSYGGPSTHVLRARSNSLHVADLRTDDRWPAFARFAIRFTSILSLLVYPLYLSSEHAIGSLSVYSASAHAFDEDTIVEGEHLAAYAAGMLGRPIGYRHRPRLSDPSHSATYLPGLAGRRQAG